MERYLRAAVLNVTGYGDTDVFPFPVENHILFDRADDVVELLAEVHKNFDGYLERYPLLHESALAVVGYTGFRVATQIDPLWNAYLLALVISIGEDIESVRVPVDRRTVFSYRFKHDQTANSVFDPTIGWVDFQKTSGADLLVLGTRGRTKLKRLLLGTIAESIVRESTCSLLAIKPAGFDYPLE